MCENRYFAKFQHIRKHVLLVIFKRLHQFVITEILPQGMNLYQYTNPEEGE